MIALHLRLDGATGAEPDIAWTISRLCEEFSCTPTAALRELEECPEPLLASILDMRAYARAKQMIDTAKSQMDVPSSPYVDLVFEVQSILWRRRQAARQANGGN